MTKHQLSRRQFNTLCAAVGLSLPTAGATIEVLTAVSVVVADAPPRTAKLWNSALGNPRQQLRRGARQINGALQGVASGFNEARSS
jgi:hypothetical protein